jgi:RHS repeat-associated protein
MGCPAYTYCPLFEPQKKRFKKVLTSEKSKNYLRRNYLFGFGGHEKDDEVKGAGNSYDYGERMYDSRLGRWLSRDPMEKKFSSESSYIFAGNNPVYYLDREGLEKTTYITTIKNGVAKTVKVVNKDYVKEVRKWYYADEGSYLYSIDWDYNVVEFVTIDEDNNRISTTGEITTDKAWDDGIAWLDDAGAEKEPIREGGNSLVARGLVLPANHAKYAPTALNRGEDIDISELLGGRGGGSLSGKTEKIVETLTKGFELGQTLGEGINELIEEVKKEEPKKSEAVGPDSTLLRFGDGPALVYSMSTGKSRPASKEDSVKMTPKPKPK